MFLLELAVVIPLFLLSAYYVGFRLFGLLKLLFPKLKKILFWTVYPIFPLCFIIPLYLPTSRFDKFILNIGCDYMGLLIIAFMILIATEFIRLILNIFHILPKKGEQRRKIHIIAGLMVCIVTSSVFGYGLINADTIDTKEYNVNINKECGISNLKIAMVADFHFGYQENSHKAESVVKAINKQNPDIVFIVGDVFDGGLDEVFDLTQIQDELSKIKSKYGVYACMGNHDVYSVELEKFYSECKINLLTDETVLIDNNFYVIGRNDRNLMSGKRSERESLSVLLKGTDSNKPFIVLDHRPDEIEVAKDNGTDLLLSGHTHAGQTFPIMFITEQIYEVDYGYAEFDNMKMIVTSGVGLWGPPARIGTDSEIVVANMTFKG